MVKKEVVIVGWDDAHGSAHREVTEDDMPHRPIRMYTVGWLLKRDDTGVSIANEHATDADSTCYRGHTFIPAGMIRSFDIYTLVAPRRSRNAKKPVVPASVTAVPGS